MLISGISKSNSPFFIVALFLAVFLFHHNLSHAVVQCTKNVNSISFGGQVFNIQRDMPKGQPFSGTISSNSQSVMTCSQANDVYFILMEAATATSTTTPSYGSSAVLNTNLSGAGITLAGMGNTGRVIPIETGRRTALIWGINGTNTSQVLFNPFAMLIKSDQYVSSGNVSGIIANLVARQGSVTGNIIASIPIYFSSTVNVLACSVNTSNINVNLPTVTASSFSGVGYTQGTQNFNIFLQCDPGAKINATMQFTQNIETTDPSVIALTNYGSTGIASGVGVQLLYQGVPLKNNTLTLLKTSTGGQEFPINSFTARYFQTKNAVKPGNASATATMTLTYQ